MLESNLIKCEQAAEGCFGETIGGCPLAGSANKPAGIGVLDVASAEQAPSNTTEGGVDEEEAAEGYRGRASRWLFQFLAISIGIVLGLFVFGRVIPRCSSSAKGAAWRSYVVAYLLISPEIALVAAAPTTLSSRQQYWPCSAGVKDCVLFVGCASCEHNVTAVAKALVPPLAARNITVRYVAVENESTLDLALRRLASSFATKESLKEAVKMWLANEEEAREEHGDISEWDVSEVTDMS